MGVVTARPPGVLKIADAVERLEWQVGGTQTTGTSKNGRLYNRTGYTLTIFDVVASCDTAPTTSSFIVDVNKNGTTLFTTQANRPTIAASGNLSSVTLPDILTIANGDYLTMDVDQIGSGTAGSNLVVTVLAFADAQA